ncbi:MAG: DMT family transporter [Desulfuromonadaceae bacterium]|nr:DMT family transporter [Desulfuromonadaceae bacterium]MDD2854682.1 DMT family transporter [Desulfuromonadaceae bacterium]
MNTPLHPTNLRVYFSLILTTIFWGGSFLFTKIGVATIPPQIFVFSRFTVASVIMLIVFARRVPKIDTDILYRGAIVGVALGLSNITFVFGVQGTSISRASVLNNLFVLFIPLVTKIVWRDKIGGLNIFCIVLAATGIAFLSASGGGFNRGDIFSTFCAFIIACHIISVSKVLKDDDVYLISLVQFSTVALIAGTISLIIPLKPFTLTGEGALSVLYCALFPTIFCFTLQNIYQRYVTPTRAGLIYTLDPVWTLIAGFFILGERLNTREWIGCGIIFLAALIPLLFRLGNEKGEDDDSATKVK